MTHKSPITTHVLDTALGRPAEGVSIILSSISSDGEWTLLASGLTNGDGRIDDLMVAGSLQAGVYQMRFEIGEYFRSLELRGFYPEAVITFEVSSVDEHYHIPLLLSPFGYSTYRGS